MDKKIKTLTDEFEQEIENKEKLMDKKIKTLTDELAQESEKSKKMHHQMDSLRSMKPRSSEVATIKRKLTMSEFNLDNTVKEKRKEKDEKHKMKMELDEKIEEIKRLEKKIDDLITERSETEKKHIQEIADKAMAAVEIKSNYEKKIGTSDLEMKLEVQQLNDAKKTLTEKVDNLTTKNKKYQEDKNKCELDMDRMRSQHKIEYDLVIKKNKEYQDEKTEYEVVKERMRSQHKTNIFLMCSGGVMIIAGYLLYSIKIKPLLQASAMGGSVEFMGLKLNLFGNKK
eukprot:294987_1